MPATIMEGGQLFWHMITVVEVFVNYSPFDGGLLFTPQYGRDSKQVYSKVSHSLLNGAYFQEKIALSPMNTSKNTSKNFLKDPYMNEM